MLTDGGFQMIEVFAAGVGFITEHHAGPLPIAHRAGAAVREQVDIHILGAQQKSIVACGGDGPLALGARG